MLKKYLPYLLIFALGILLASLFMRSCHKVAPPTLAPVERIVEVAVAKYNPVNDSLVKALAVSKATEANLYAKLQVAQINNRVKAREAITVAIPCDTAGVCNEAITGLIAAAVEADSACNADRAVLVETIEQQGQLLTAKDSLTSGLRLALNTAADNALASAKYEGQLKRKLLVKSVGGKFWKLAAIGLAGLVVFLKFLK